MALAALVLQVSSVSLAGRAGRGLTVALCAAYGVWAVGSVLVSVWWARDRRRVDRWEPRRPVPVQLRRRRVGRKRKRPVILRRD